MQTNDWSRGSVTPLALNLGGEKPHSTHYGQSYDIFNKYANSNPSHSNSISQPQNHNFVFNPSNNSGQR